MKAMKRFFRDQSGKLDMTGRFILVHNIIVVFSDRMITKKQERDVSEIEGVSQLGRIDESSIAIKFKDSYNLADNYKAMLGRIGEILSIRLDFKRR